MPSMTNSPWAKLMKFIMPQIKRETRGEQRVDGSQQKATDDHLHDYHLALRPADNAQSAIGRRRGPD